MGTRRVCNVCCKQIAQYTCPRCHKAYCTSACYKQHGQQCTEAFYREQATSQLKSTRADAEQTRQMMSILQRLYEQQQAEGGSSDSDSENSEAGGASSEEDDEDFLEGQAVAALGPHLKQLLKRAEREGAAAFDITPEDLTPELMQELQALSIRGDLSHMVTPWQPWWLSEAAAHLQLNASGQKIIQEIQQLHDTVKPILSPQQHQQQAQQYVLFPSGSTAAGEAEAAAQVADTNGGSAAVLPKPPEEPLPRLLDLSGKHHQPSPLLRWQLLQLLVGYCAVLRLFNGEPDDAEEASWEAAEQLLMLAPPLAQIAPPHRVPQQPVPQSNRTGTAAATVTSTTTSSSSRTNPEKMGKDAGKQGCSEPGREQKLQRDRVADEEGGVVPDTARSAFMQLLETAAQLEATGSSFWGADADAARGDCCHTAAAAGEVSGNSRSSMSVLSAEMRALLQVAAADALKLLQLGRPAVVLALTDSHRLLQQGKEHLKQHMVQQKQQPKKHVGRSGQQQQLRQHFSLAVRKLLYFMAWSNEQPPVLYQGLAHELALELHEQQAMVRPQQGISLTGAIIQPVRQPQPAPLTPVVAVDAAPAAASNGGLYDID